MNKNERDKRKKYNKKIIQIIQQANLRKYTYNVVNTCYYKGILFAKYTIQTQFRE